MFILNKYFYLKKKKKKMTEKNIVFVKNHTYFFS